MRRALAIAGLAAVAGCGGGDSAGGTGMTVTEADVTSRVVDAPEALYLSAAWLAEDRIVTATEVPDAQPRRSELQVMRPDGSGVRTLDPDVDDGTCRRQRVGAPSVLPDGRLAFPELCDFAEIERPERIRLYAWDLEGDPELLLSTDTSFDAFTFRPGLREGLYDSDSSICAGIGEIRGEALRPLDLKLPGETWSLGGALTAGGSDCAGPDVGRARGPAFSPDGQTIGFAASPQSIGVEGQSRLDAPWNLYVMDAEERRPRAIVEDVKSLSGPRWSPDGEWMAFNGEIDGDAGVFLVRPQEPTVIAVTTRKEDGVTAWSPNGRELLIVRTDFGEAAELPKRSELVRFDVAKIVAR